MCPDAAIAIISNPVNSTVPIASEIFKKAGKYVLKVLFIYRKEGNNWVLPISIVALNTYVTSIFSGTIPQKFLVLVLWTL